jgi:predicted transport protein
MQSDLDTHFYYADEERRPLLVQIRAETRNLDSSLVERVTAGHRIAYHKPGKKIFLEIKIQRHAIMLHMTDVPDPGQLLSKIPDTHEWRQLSRRVKIENEQELKRVLPLIRLAWQRS